MIDENAISVRLFHNLFPVARCKATCLGLLGLQIDSGPFSYPKGTLVEVELSVDGNHGENVVRIPAVVSNYSDGQMRLSFQRHDMKTNATLLSIIARSQDHAAGIE